jgi:hypothetical protein
MEPTWRLDSDRDEVNNLWNNAASQPQQEKWLARLRKWRIRSQYHTRGWPKKWR